MSNPLQQPTKRPPSKKALFQESLFVRNPRRQECCQAAYDLICWWKYGTFVHACFKLSLGRQSPQFGV